MGKYLKSLKTRFLSSLYTATLMNYELKSYMQTFIWTLYLHYKNRPNELTSQSVMTLESRDFGVHRYWSMDLTFIKKVEFDALKWAKYATSVQLINPKIKM